MSQRKAKYRYNDPKIILKDYQDGLSRSLSSAIHEYVVAAVKARRAWGGEYKESCAEIARRFGCNPSNVTMSILRDRVIEWDPVAHQWNLIPKDKPRWMETCPKQRKSTTSRGQASAKISTTSRGQEIEAPTTSRGQEVNHESWSLKHTPESEPDLRVITTKTPGIKNGSGVGDGNEEVEASTATSPLPLSTSQSGTPGGAAAESMQARGQGAPSLPLTTSGSGSTKVPPSPSILADISDAFRKAAVAATSHWSSGALKMSPDDTAVLVRIAHRLDELGGGPAERHANLVEWCRQACSGISFLDEVLRRPVSVAWMVKCGFDR